MDSALRSFLVIVFLIVATAATYAQTYIGGRWGYTVSTVSLRYGTTQETPNKYIADFGAVDFGLIFKHYDNDYIGFHGQAYITQRGYREVLEDLEEWSEYKRMNTYVEVPIMIQGRLKSRGAFIHAQTGCYGAFLLHSSHGYAYAPREYEIESYTINILNDNRFDFGLISGFGFGVDFNWGTLQVEGNYLFGYADLYKHTQQDNPTTSRAFTYSATISYLANLSNLMGNFRRQRSIPSNDDSINENSKIESLED